MGLAEYYGLLPKANRDDAVRHRIVIMGVLQLIVVIGLICEL